MKGATGSGFEEATITNGGFEAPVKTDGADVFEWKVSRGTYPQVGVTDSQKLSGNYSLLVLLTSQEAKDFKGPAQTIAVRPGVSYELVTHYRSDAKSAATFHWEVVSAADGRRLAISPPLDASPQWNTSSTPFAVPQDAEGVEIRFVRGECVGTKCAATGSFWFDDISLNRK
jgi:hypothetical protein